MMALPAAMTAAPAPSVTNASFPTLPSRFFLTKRMLKLMLVAMNPTMNPTCTNKLALIFRPPPTRPLMGEAQQQRLKSSLPTNRDRLPPHMQTH